MLEQAHSVVVLLTSDYSHHLLVMGLAGGDMDDDVLSAQGATVVRPGVAVTSLHCIETGDDLEVDENYAVFHTGKLDGQARDVRAGPAHRGEHGRVG